MKLGEAVTTFLGDYSPNTARAYECGLKRFFAWSRERGIVITSVADLDPKWVLRFARSLKREGLSAKSIGLYMTAVVQFLHWLKREKAANISAESFFDLKERVKAWNRNNATQPLPRLPKEDAVVSALVTAHHDDADTERQRLYQLRNAALIELLVSTGCRISEAAGLKRMDLVPAQMAAWVRGGKGRKDRLIIFASEGAWRTVQTYLEERDRMGLVPEGVEPVFARHDKAAHGRGELLPMTTNSMRAAVDNVLEKAGTDHFTPHQLRHRAGTNLLKRTGNLEMVRKYLGHADVSTTARTYMHLTNEDLIEAVRGG